MCKEKPIIKAIATADLHLDINNRIEDKTAVLRQIARYAVNEEVHAVFILGDIYERKRPYNSEKAVFEKFVKYLSDNFISVVILAGNHDTDKDGISAVEEFQILGLPRISVVNNPSLVNFDNHKLLLGHFLISGAKLGPDDFSTSRAVNLKDIMKAYKADLYLFGDVHKAQKLHENPDALYIGSPERNTFGERREKKGFTLITSDENSKLSYKFIPLKTREMVEFDIVSPNKWLASKIPDVTGAIVKLKITCSKGEYRKLNEKDFLDKLSNAHSVKLEYNILKENRIRTNKINEGQSVAEAFKNYADFVKLDKDVVELGLEIIREKK